jgi:hypothetical protein
LKLASLDHFNLSPAKITLLALVTAAGVAFAAGEALGDVLGGVTVPVLFVIAALMFYIVVSTPRRLLDSQRVAQAKESVLLSAAASACLGVSGSRSRTLLLLRSRDTVISQTISEIGRRVLLGAKVSDALSISSERLASYSAVASLSRVASIGRVTFDSGDEESRGLASSSDLSRETKLPVFMTACFFTPIMLLLYAVFSHSYSGGSLAELIALEFIILDLTFYLSSGDRGPR